MKQSSDPLQPGNISHSLNTKTIYFFFIFQSKMCSIFNKKVALVLLHLTLSSVLLLSSVCTFMHLIKAYGAINTFQLPLAVSFSYV